MYVIVVYDCGVERLDKVRKYLNTYLNRIQNSVFEGELTEAKLERMRVGIAKRISSEDDSVLIWTLRDPRWIDRHAMGRAKLPASNIL